MEDKIYRDYRGIRGLMAAKILKDTDGVYECEEPFWIAGASTLTKETATSAATKYYDNVPAIIISAAGSDTVSIDTSAIDEAVVAKLTGQDYFDEHGMLVEGEPSNDYYAFGYITEKTDGTEVFVWRNKGQFSPPNSTHATKNEGTDSNGQTITFTGISTTGRSKATGKPFRATMVDQSINKWDEEEFFAQVQTPDTILEKAQAGAEPQSAGVVGESIVGQAVAGQEG